MKDYKNAKEWIGKALKNGGETSPTILEHYGDILFQLGDVDGATNYWTQALDNGGKSEFLEKKIADRKLYE
jgi:predicted negative regulator of RcsB-dependent stress response